MGFWFDTFVTFWRGRLQLCLSKHVGRHRFCYVVFSSPFISKWFLNFCGYFFLLKSELFGLHIFTHPLGPSYWFLIHSSIACTPFSIITEYTFMFCFIQRFWMFKACVVIQRVVCPRTRSPCAWEECVLCTCWVESYKPGFLGYSSCSGVCLFTELLPGCSAHYWKWRTEVSNYYYWILLQFCFYFINYGALLLRRICL